MASHEYELAPGYIVLERLLDALNAEPAGPEIIAYLEANWPRDIVTIMGRHVVTRNGLIHWIRYRMHGS